MENEKGTDSSKLDRNTTIFNDDSEHVLAISEDELNYLEDILNSIDITDELDVEFEIARDLKEIIDLID